MTRDDAEEIKKRLNENLERMLQRFWPGYKKRGNIAYCAPASKHDNGSFIVYLSKQRKHDRGSWLRFSAGIGGDEINLFAYGFTAERTHRADKEVFDAAREFVGMAEAQPETAEQRRQRERWDQAAAEKRAADERRAQEEDAERQRSAGGIWSDCIDLAGTLGEAYLVDTREIPVPPGGWYDSVRFHPLLRLHPDQIPSSSNPAFPCLVWRVDDIFGDLTALWRIYLDRNNPVKAPIREAKMGFGPAAGGAIRLGGLADHIGAAEGAESAAGAHALIKYRYPVWSMMSTSGLIGFEIPMEVDWITGFPDGDKPWKKVGDDIVLAEPAGRAAMRKLGERVRAIDKRFDAQPEPSIRKDYNDLWIARKRLEERA